jgi:hypothetical protein
LIEPKLICEACRLQVQTLLTIGELGGAAFYVQELTGFEVCTYCDARVMGDDRHTMYWVPLSTIILYECRMALMEDKKRKLKNRSALEDVQSKLLVGTELTLVYGPSGQVKGQLLRGPLSCLRVVSARTRTGVEFKNELGHISEMRWPEMRYLRLTEHGFEIVDDADRPLLRYEWAVEAALAAQ